MNGLTSVPETEQVTYVKQRLIEMEALLGEYPDEAKARVNDAAWFFIRANADNEFGVQSTIAQWLIWAWAMVEDVLEETVDDGEE